MEDLRPKIQDPLWSRITIAAHASNKTTACYVRLLLAQWANTQKPGAPGVIRLPAPALLPVTNEGEGKQRRLPLTDATTAAIRHAAIDAGLGRKQGFMLVRVLEAIVPPLEDSLEVIRITKKGPAAHG